MICTCCLQNDEFDSNGTLIIDERELMAGISKVVCTDCANEIESAVYASEAYMKYVEINLLLGDTANAAQQYPDKNSTLNMLIARRREQHNLFIALRSMVIACFKAVRNLHNNDHGDEQSHSNQNYN